MPGFWFKLSHDCFCARPFQFIVHYHSVISHYIAHVIKLRLLSTVTADRGKIISQSVFFKWVKYRQIRCVGSIFLNTDAMASLSILKLKTLFYEILLQCWEPG
jgi:hypothetical protein